MTAKIHHFLPNLTCRIRGPWKRNSKCHISPPRCRIANIWCRHVNIYGGLPTWLIWINKNISFYSSEYCVFNIIIIFWFMILSELGPKGQCSKIVNFNRTEAGLTSKWGRILPAVQWFYQKQSNSNLWRCTVSREIENFNFSFLTLPLAHVELYLRSDRSGSWVYTCTV